jgi:hypothetical protein
LKIKIFYSWQSDIKAASNRTLIQNALEGAAKDIRNDDSIQIEPVVDRDTFGVPGSPDIGSTIFNKIDRSAIFVADVTIVNNHLEGRPTPNPNVLIELGYALKSIGESRTILVQNTAFGNPELLPFDLRQKRILAYNSPVETVSRVNERKFLRAQFLKSISLIVEGIDTMPEISYPIALSIDYEKIKIESKRHDYQLQVELKNEGTRNIDEWHVDVIFPTALLNPSVTYALAVPERTDHVYTHFRSSQDTHPGVIFPGDKKLVLSIDYYVDTNIYRMRQDLFQNKVNAISYVQGQQVANVEKNVTDLQIF